MVIDNNEHTIVKMFDDSIVSNSSRIALISETKSISYGELNLLSIKVAHYLCSRYALKKGDRIICNFDRDINSIIMILSLIRLGVIYVPIIPEFGKKRTEYIENLIEPSIILNNSHHNEHIADLRCPIIDIHLIINGSFDIPHTDLNVNISENDILCILFTSGSSGMPKGVILTHEGCVNRIKWMLADQPYTNEEYCLQNTKFTTVDSIWEIFSPLLSGNKLLIVEENIRYDIRLLLSKLADYNIKRICLVPSLLKLIIEIYPNLGKIVPNLKLWVLSGEVLSKNLCKKFYKIHPNANLFNQYGLTETSADVSFYDTSKLFFEGNPNHKFNKLKTIPIGNPITNVKFILRDQDGLYSDTIKAGELCVYGKCLSPGYYGGSIMMNSKYNVYISERHDEYRILHTGDYVILNEDGVYEFLNRIDDLINIKGFKIYPQEIERFIESLDYVVNCKVHFNKNFNQLCLYFVPNKKNKEKYIELREKIYKSCLYSLPNYMIPKLYVMLEEFPKTASGKIDLANIPNPKEEHLLSSTIDLSINKLSYVSIKDSFFSLGGDSLSLMKLSLCIQQNFNIHLSIDKLYKYDTVEEQSALINSVLGVSHKPSEKVV